VFSVQVSVFRISVRWLKLAKERMVSSDSGDRAYLDVGDLRVYQKLCQLHIEVCDLSQQWPKEEKYELGSQVRRSSNSSPAQLAEKNDDRHIRNKIEGVNRSRGDAAETIHHLFRATLKGYIVADTYRGYRARYKECIRMLNGLEKTLERQLPEKDRRGPLKNLLPHMLHRVPQGGRTVRNPEH
jgi:four helix bundle protein